MAKNQRSWGVIGGLVILCGLLTDGAALGQNAPADQNNVNAASDQNAAAGQTTQAAANQTAAQEGQQLQEVVVTATHFATAVNETPITITAVTVNNLLQQGLNNFSDLASSVPSVSITQAVGTGLGTIAIRGIIQAVPGAATTGFYLDNAPLQQWNNALSSGSGATGTPLPPIFDLSRVEVLEGPQGTLFGASSEGGTIRYITPTPNLQTYSVYAKLDSSVTDHAQGINYAPGVAVGGPIIPGVLGFRASVYDSHQAGYINMEDPYTSQVFAKGLNSLDQSEFHGALLWQPTANFSAQPSYFYSKQSTPYASGAYDEPEPYPIVVPTVGYNTTGITPAHPNSNPTPVCVGAAACAAYTGTLTYLKPGATYGPYNVGPYTVVGTPEQAAAPDSTTIGIPSLDLTYTLPSFTTQLFSSYVFEVANESTVSNTNVSRATEDAQEGPLFIPYGVGLDAADPYVGYLLFPTTSRNKTITEDLRFTSAQGPTQLGAGLLSWTAGLYYSHNWIFSEFENYMPTGQLDSIAENLFGINATQRWGAAPICQGVTCANQIYAINAEWLSNTNAAAYGEANFNITNHLQATAGVRWSKVGFTFNQAHYGPVSGDDVATIANGGLAAGSTSSTPFTPKGELTYRFTDNRLVYALVDEGFRPGGANTPLPAAICAPGLALYGLVPNDIPTSYGPDTDWNYELGTKLNLANGRVQLNGDVFHLVWEHVQATTTVSGCADDFTVNVGSAISQGIELSGQAIIARFLNVNWSFGTDHAYYTAQENGVTGPLGTLVVAEQGQDLPVPTWTGDIGARLDLAALFRMGGSYDPYFRADFRDVGPYNLSEYPLNAYAPVGNHIPSAPLLDLRAGVEMGAIDLNVYALNALNDEYGPLSGAQSSCKNAACTSYLTASPFTTVSPPQPLTVGLQLTYMH